MSFSEIVGKPEIDDFDLIVPVDQYIVWGKIAMHIAFIMDVLQSTDNLPHVVADLLLVEFFLSDQPSQSGAAIFQHEINTILCFFVKMKFDDVGMVEFV